MVLFSGALGNFSGRARVRCCGGGRLAPTGGEGFDGAGALAVAQDDWAVAPTAPVPATLPTGERVAGLAEAVVGRRRVRLRYRSARSGETERTVEPYSLLEGEGRWYLFAYCRLRQGARLFRLDRVLWAETLEETFERPPGLEKPEAVLRAVANSHRPWEVEVLLETSMERAREMVPPMLASLEETDGGVLLRSTTPDLGGMARVLSGLFCQFVVLKPPELREALVRHAREIAALAERTYGVPAPANRRSQRR